MKHKKIVDSLFDCKDCGKSVRTLAQAVAHSKKYGHRIYGFIKTEWNISYKMKK